MAPDLTPPAPSEALAFLTAEPGALGAAFQRYWCVHAPALGPLAPYRQGQQLLCGLRLLAAHQGGKRFNVVCRRLASYLRRCGLRAEHYDLAGAALLTSLRDILGPRFDDAAEAHWGALYGEAAEAMLASLRT